MKRLFESIAFLVLISIIISCTQKTTVRDISGIWEGTVQFPGFSYRIAFVFSADKDTQVDVIFPDQSDKAFSASSLKFFHLKISIVFDQIHAQFNGELNEDKLTGIWEQAGRSMPLQMVQVKEISTLRRPQTPKAPFPYNEQEISFENGNVHIAGTLTTPKNLNTFPAVILIPGVGSHERDNTFFGHRPFFVIADFLTRNGIAVLRYDERGVGSSTGDRFSATTEDFAQDVMAGVNYLILLPQIAEIGLIGHSEGGTIASLIAAQMDEISLIIVMGSPGLKGVDYNLQFEKSISKIMGASDEEIEKKIEFQKKVLAMILEKENEDSAAVEIDKLYLELDPNIPKKNRDASVKRFLSPWFKYNVTYNPSKTLQTITCPVLALFGEKDMQVPPEGNAEAVKNALMKSRNKNYEVRIIPGVNHYFQTAQTGSPDEYRLIEETLSPIVLDIMYNWIYEQQKKIKHTP